MNRPERSGEQLQTLDALLSGCQAAFGRDLFALYVYGAITFPETEGVVDLDYHVIVERQPDSAQSARYEAAGADLARNHAPWGADLDGWVVLREQAGGSGHPEHLLHPGLEDGSWALHRAHWLAGRCLVLFGPNPADLARRPAEKPAPASPSCRRSPSFQVIGTAERGCNTSMAITSVTP